MAVWFRKISDDEFSSFGARFWFREWRCVVAEHADRCLSDCVHEWYDIRNWAALLLLPVAVTLSPIYLMESIKTKRLECSAKGMTVSHQKNIDELKARRAEHVKVRAQV